MASEQAPFAAQASLSGAPLAVGLGDVRRAARRLRGQAIVTPLLESWALNEALGGRVLIKAECLQRGGAFKFRGAYNRLSQLTAAQRRNGVVAFSSGNHAQGVALAARQVGTSALIVMPADAPLVKIEGTRALGAEVVFYDRGTQNREAIADEIAGARRAVIVPAYDDPAVIAGQGVVGLEILAQAKAASAAVDIVAGPVGGGGLMAGVGAAVGALSPTTRIFGVEPEGFDDTRLSLETGKRRAAPPHPRSLCDALEAPMPGRFTFPLLQRHLAGMAAVSDAAVLRAMRYAFFALKLVVEPGGAVALAALLERKIVLNGRTAAIILSGGNVDGALFTKAIAN
jgi:threonine dehydratase